MRNSISKKEGSLLLKMARASIGEKLGVQPELPELPEDQSFLENKQGLFVTLHKKGKLRGCIGTIEPVKRLGRAIVENAKFAAFRDHRFSPLSKDEFNEVDIEISLLSVPEKFEYESSGDLVNGLEPHKDGVIIEKGGARATFLPQVWEQLPNCDVFLTHLCVKAGLAADAWEKEKINVYTYGVQSFGEKS